MATGRRDSLRPRRRPSGAIHDNRVAGLIAGVANHEARRVYDQRVARARQALADVALDKLGAQLREACLLELWRARSITGFDAFAQDVVGLDAARARELVEQAANGASNERLPDVAVALWFRSEAALLEHYPDAVVRVDVEGERVKLSLDVALAPPGRAADAVATVGRAAAGLARILSEKPHDNPRDKPRPR